MTLEVPVPISVFEPIGQIDLSSHRFLRESIDDRSSFGFDEALCFYIGLTRVHINADFDRRVKGIQDFGGHASENVEMGQRLAPSILRAGFYA